MNGQQMIALAIVAVAAAYLGRNLVRAWQAFRGGKNGCASGCGKCGFAPGDKADRAKPERISTITLTESRPHKNVN